jgi:hypothetical protein
MVTRLTNVCHPLLIKNDAHQSTRVAFLRRVFDSYKTTMLILHMSPYNPSSSQVRATLTLTRLALPDPRQAYLCDQSPI